MECKECKKQLLDFMEGSLSTEDRSRVELHLASCDSCIKAAEKMETYMHVIETEKSLVSNPFLATRIVEQLNSGNQITARSWIKILQPAVITFVMVLALFTGIMLGNSYKSTLSYNGTVNQIDDLYFNEINQENIENILLNDNNYE